MPFIYTCRFDVIVCLLLLVVDLIRCLSVIVVCGLLRGIVRCALCVGCCLVFVVCCLLCVVCCVPFGVFCLLCIVCCVMRIIGRCVLAVVCVLSRAS